MDDDETVRDIAKATEDFSTRVTEPDLNAVHVTQRKVGSVTAWERRSGVTAGSLSFGIAEDEQGNLVVRTTQFKTDPEFEGRYVALLLAHDLREHFGVDALRSTSMEPTEGGSAVLASLRRRGIMTPAEEDE